jgi:hypothetical protein
MLAAARTSQAKAAGRGTAMRSAGDGRALRLPDDGTDRRSRSAGSAAPAATGSGPVPACGRPFLQPASNAELRRLVVVETRRLENGVVSLLERPG